MRALNYFAAFARRGGDFLWKQAHKIASHNSVAGSTHVAAFIAMFDEYDEVRISSDGGADDDSVFYVHGVHVSIEKIISCICWCVCFCE